MRLALLTGKLAAPYIQDLVREVQVENLETQVFSVTNEYFGHEITVAGLLTAQDLLAAWQDIKADYDGLIIPGTALRKGEAVFLDDMTLAEFEEKVGVPVGVSEFAPDLKQYLYHWQES